MPQPRQRKSREIRGAETQGSKQPKSIGESDAGISSKTDEGEMTATSSLVGALRRQPVWIVLAVSSGACAAFNGVFAKLTTTALTSTLSSHIALFLSLSAGNKVIEFLVRGTFFLLNLAFNAAMWALFTAALTRADSTTRVSIVNVSANFMVTAVLGWMIFNEKLNGLWWGGAALLAAGNVIIGRREEGKKPGGTVGLDESEREAEEAEGLLGGHDSGSRGGTDRVWQRETLVELEDAPLEPRTSESDERSRLRRAEEADAPL